MYARVLRKWSLNEKSVNNIINIIIIDNKNYNKNNDDNNTNTNIKKKNKVNKNNNTKKKIVKTTRQQRLPTTKQMSLMWLVVVLTMLLVFVCTPMNVAAATIASTSINQQQNQYQQQQQQQQEEQEYHYQYLPQRMRLNFGGASSIQTAMPIISSTVPANIKQSTTENVGPIEEKYYIPVEEEKQEEEDYVEEKEEKVEKEEEEEGEEEDNNYNDDDKENEENVESQSQSSLDIADVVSNVAKSNTYSNRLLNTLSNHNVNNSSSNISNNIINKIITTTTNTTTTTTNYSISSSNSKRSNHVNISFSPYNNSDKHFASISSNGNTNNIQNIDDSISAIDANSLAYSYYRHRQPVVKISSTETTMTNRSTVFPYTQQLNGQHVAGNMADTKIDDNVENNMTAKQSNVEDDLVKETVPLNADVVSKSKEKAENNADKIQKVPNVENSQKVFNLFNHSIYANTHSRKIVSNKTINTSNTNKNINTNTPSNSMNNNNNIDSSKIKTNTSSNNSNNNNNNNSQKFLIRSEEDNHHKNLWNIIRGAKTRRHANEVTTSTTETTKAITIITPKKLLDSKHSTKAEKSSSTKTSIVPYRYIIESFEVPSSLPLSGELTDQQLRMLLYQQHLNRMRALEQQVPRNRRDSHTFGMLPSTVNSEIGTVNVASDNSNNDNIGLGSILQQNYHSHFYNTPMQTSYQRLNTNSNSNINNNNNLQQQQRLLHQNHQYPNHHHHHQHQQHQQNQQQQHQSQRNQYQQNQYHYNQQQQGEQQQKYQQLQQYEEQPTRRSHHQHQRYSKHQRKRGRRYCSARDPAQLAFEAPTVFEGKIISMTPDRRANFSATVEVKDIFKQQIRYRLPQYVRLKFAYRNKSGECDIYREQLRPRGLVRGDELEQGRIYLFFVRQLDTGNFTILGQPIRKTRRVVDSVKEAVSENYAQFATIRSITPSNRTVENGKELRIICKVQGRPPPKVTWFKDHKSINRNRDLYHFEHYKKRSELIIRSFNSSDAGRYECRAKNKVNRKLERRTIAIKAYPVPRYETHLTGETGNKCPDDASEFCFNGGTCQFFSAIGSYSCICPEGFVGERCDRKEANSIPPSTYSNEQECGDKKYLGSYYC